MRPEKNFKYYFRLYLISLVVYLGYVAFLAYQNDGFDMTLLFGATYIPVLFILFMFVFDKIFDRIFPSKEKKTDDQYKVFLDKITKLIDEKLDFSIEDFRRLRTDARFQKALHHAYLIIEQGETDDINVKFLEKKFKNGTNEAKAMEIIIDEVKKMM